MTLYRKRPTDPGFHVEDWLESLRECFYDGLDGLPLDRQQADAADACAAELRRQWNLAREAQEHSEQAMMEWHEKLDALEEERENFEEEKAQRLALESIGGGLTQEPGMTEAVDRFSWALKSGKLQAFVALGVGPQGTLEVISSMGDDENQTAQNIVRIVGFMDIIKVRLGNHVKISPSNPGLQLVQDD